MPDRSVNERRSGGGEQPERARGAPGLQGRTHVPPTLFRSERGASGEDPVPGVTRPLHPTARRLLQAARRVLERDGLAAVSLKSVSREAEEHPSLIAYHFGDKAGLLMELADSLTPRDSIATMVAATSELPPGPERVRVLCDGLKEMAADREGMLAFFEILPHVVRDRRLRPEVAGLYEWYRDLNVTMLGVEAPPEERERLRYFGAVLVAAVDGLGVQGFIDPEGFDVERAFDVVAEVADLFLSGCARNGGADVEDGGAAGG